ncbi:MAG: fumarylacetoacetate hydrolase family protein, partial [Actinomycetota bacterium]|nr:fumarylacetoacetate hydrolase family protein [Actinomycetota bacterium]
SAAPSASRPVAEVELLAPIDGRTPVWAAGVTYTISRDARIEESAVEDVYAKVYDAPRPELFFKANAHEVMTDGDPVGRRDDSHNDTPEPELGLVLNRQGSVIAYTVVNDMSSRSIEGENPLYLPQAKMFAGSCVVAPTLRLASEIANPLDLTIHMTITRSGAAVFDDVANTGRLHRSLTELAEFLFRAQPFPDGAILSTGTCLVPALDAPVVDGDVVTISIDGIGQITNVVTPTSQLLS